MIGAMKQYIRNESGVTATEYALIASLIAVTIIGVVTTLGGKVSTVFGEISNTLH
jgi:pilus assembly protein Flp/PilA